MDEMFSPKRRGPEGGPEPTASLDPTVDLRLERRPWEIRTAQWQAWVLAEAAFGPEVQVRLGGLGGPKTYRGLLTVRVPFPSLPAHREREALFMSWVDTDPVLSRLPLIYVFEPWKTRSARDLP